MALKNSYKEFDNEKKFLRLENSPPPPPHNFSNGPSNHDQSQATIVLLIVPPVNQHQRLMTTSCTRLNWSRQLHEPFIIITLPFQA